MAYNVLVDKEKCVGCGECVEMCPMSVYEIQNNKSVPVLAEECIGCRMCVEVCQPEAIIIKEA